MHCRFCWRMNGEAMGQCREGDWDLAAERMIGAEWGVMRC